MGCYCGSKLLHTKCVYTWLDVAPSLFRFHRLCWLLSVFWNLFSVFSKMQIWKPCSWGSSLLVLKPRQFCAKKPGVFQKEEVKKEGLPEVEWGTLPSLWLRGSVPAGVSPGQHTRICLPGKEGLERSCAAIRASQLREVNPHCPRVQGTLCVPGEPATTQRPMCFVTHGFLLGPFVQNGDRFIACVWPDRKGSREAEWWHL